MKEYKKYLIEMDTDYDFRSRGDADEYVMQQHDRERKLAKRKVKNSGKIYVVYFGGQEGTSRDQIKGIVRANSEEEAQDKLGINPNERGFFPADIMSPREFEEKRKEAERIYDMYNSVD